mgnify:CR=1 FL=1
MKLTRQKEGPAISVKEFLALKKPKGDFIVEVEREHVSVTSLDRVYWPDEKLTKFDLLQVLPDRSALSIMPFLQGPAGHPAKISARDQSADVLSTGHTKARLLLSRQSGW